jgi:transcriptional regulator with XRE-family HTH domain
MESVSEESLLKETEIVASPPANFGELLRRRREEAGLSVADLARKTGVVRTTIHNIEQGLTSASPQTLKLLASVKSLRLTELDASQGAALDTWFTQQYDPMQMVRGMDAVLNGPGGQIEQTLWYLDPQSAADWYALSNSEQYITAFRSKMPLDKLAERIIRESKGVGLDVDGLGCGDGKTETALMQRLADHMPTPPDLHLYLLDISHLLLYGGIPLRAGCARSSPHPGRCDPRQLQRRLEESASVYAPSSIRRMRVFLMMGYTFGNINDEPWFFRDLAACAQPGDLAVLDFQTIRAPADQPEEQIRAADRAFKAKRQLEAYSSFLGGPLRRHCRGLLGIRLHTELATHCPVPGSYAVEFWADVEKEGEPLRQFLVWRTKRYDIDKLRQCLQRLGWNTLQTWKYGADKHAAALLIQRQ